MDLAIPILHLLATGFMTGLIWFVQVVHYPLFAAVGQDAFTEYERRHMQRTGAVVGPPMVVEVGCAVWLALSSGPLGLVGLALLAVVWLSTWGRQVPLHHRLSARGDQRDIRQLVASNWVRTAAWTARLPIALAILVKEAAV